jgi:hypothetical protein
MSSQQPVLAQQGALACMHIAVHTLIHMRCGYRSRADKVAACPLPILALGVNSGAQRVWYRMPDRRSTREHAQRRVGFELEFSGLSLQQTAQVLIQSLGATPISTTAAEQRLRVEDLGEFSVEIDWSLLKRTAAQAEHPLAHEVLQQVGRAAQLLVPVEVVCPPLPLDALERLDPMVVALRKAGAKGTSSSLVAAFGTHINAEAPDLEAQTVHDYQRAFCLLQWWLQEAHEVDATRRLSTYVELYPEAYLDCTLAEAPASEERLFDEYLRHNPSRNRALDLLPLLAEIDEARVREAIDDPRINARPAFHYRLPNCSIERADWSLQQPWNLWWVVEQLALRRADLDALAAHFRSLKRPLLGVSRKHWLEHIGPWLQDHGLA